MSSRVRQDEPPGRSRQRQIAKVNDIPSLNLPLNFRLTFLSFVYFGKRPKNFYQGEFAFEYSHPQYDWR